MGIVATVLLALIFCWLIVVTALVLLLLRSAKTFVSSPGENQPSPLGIFIANVSTILASTLAMHLKTSLLGQASAMSKAVRTIEGEVAAGNVENGSPLAAALLDQYPKLRKRIEKSPVLALALSQIDFSKMFKFVKTGGPPAGTGGDNHSDTTQLKMGV